MIRANQFRILFHTLANQFYMYKAKQLPTYIKKLFRANQFPIPLKRIKILPVGFNEVCLAKHGTILTSVFLIYTYSCRKKDNMVERETLRHCGRCKMN